MTAEQFEEADKRIRQRAVEDATGTRKSNLADSFNNALDYAVGQNVDVTDEEAERLLKNYLNDFTRADAMKEIEK